MFLYTGWYGFLCSRDSGLYGCQTDIRDILARLYRSFLSSPRCFLRVHLFLRSNVRAYLRSIRYMFLEPWSLTDPVQKWMSILLAAFGGAIFIGSRTSLPILIHTFAILSPTQHKQWRILIMTN